MASVHRDKRSPQGVWYCSYQLADGRRTFRSTRTKNKTRASHICDAWQTAERAAEDGTLCAERVAEILHETLQRIGQSPVARIRLGDWFDDWEASKTNVTDALRKRYRFAADTFMEFLGPGSDRRLLESVTDADIRKFAAKLKSEGRCAATVNRIIRADLGNAFNRAVNTGKLKFNPIASVSPEKDKDKKEHTAFTTDQVAQLVNTTRGSDWQGAVLFGYTTGARLQDVCNLRWDSIQLQAGVVEFMEGKKGQKTVKAIHPDFENWIMDHISDDPKGFVFPTLANRINGLSKEFSAIVQKAGIDAGLIREKKGEKGRDRKNLTFHSLRHTAASSVYNAAVTKEIARRLTGHAERGALDRYIHLDLSVIKNAASLIPRLPV